MLNTNFDSYKEWAGEIQQRDNGSLIAHETGAATSYAMFSAQERGILFIKPQTEVYEGMVVGIHQHGRLESQRGQEEGSDERSK